jgi:hypothetical protein
MIMPNLDQWINQSSKNEELTMTTNKFKNYLLAIRAEHQTRIRFNLHPTDNAYREKIVELIN